MNYSMPKEKLIQEIREKAYAGISMHMYSSNMRLDNLEQTIRNAVTEAIVSAFKVLVDNTYTDQQFEQDLKLKS